MLTIRLAKGVDQAPGTRNQTVSLAGTPNTSNQPIAAPVKSVTASVDDQDDDGSKQKAKGLVFSGFPWNEDELGLDIVGYKVIRRTGEKVHFCVQCNFPIATYGRLEPCTHAFCYTCARGNKKCYLCEAEVTKIRQLSRSEGLYICGAPGCLRSFLLRSDFASHMKTAHSDLCLASLRKAKVDPLLTGKGQGQVSGAKRPRTSESVPKLRQDPSPAAAPSTPSGVSGQEPSVGGISGPAPRPGTSQQRPVPSQEHFEDPHRAAQQPFFPPGHPGPFPNMRMPPDFHQGPMRPMGRPGGGVPPGMGGRPRELMGPMDGRGPGPMGPWDDMGAMGGLPPPFMNHPPQYHNMQFNGPRGGGFRPGAPDDPSYGWGGGNQNFGPGPGFGGGWRPA